MSIKISEVRNFKTVAKQILDTNNTEEQKRYIVNVNSSQMIYKLFGCNFIFFDSINHGESIAQAGIGATRPEAKDLELRIKYKSVTRKFKSTFLEDLSVQTNNRLHLVDSELNPIVDLQNNPEEFFGNQTELARPNERTSTAGEVSDEERDKNTYLYGNTLDSDGNGKSFSKSESWKQKQLNKIKEGFNKKLDSIKSSANKFVQDEKKVVMGEIKKLENQVLEQIRRKKGDLLNQLISNVKKNLGVVQITPQNVYYGNDTPKVLDNFANQLGSGLANTAVNFIRNVNNIVGP